MSQRDKYLRWWTSRTPEQVEEVRRKSRERAAQARLDQPEHARAIARASRAKHKELLLQKARQWRAEHKERIAEYNKQWLSANRALGMASRTRWYNANRERMVARQNEKYRTDLHFRIKVNLRGRLYTVLSRRRLNGWKSAATMTLVGCSLDELIQHLTGLFTEGMSWDNYGRWHIDHKRPCDSFDLTRPEEQRECFHFSNLQPMWAADNIRKGSRWVDPGRKETILCS